MSRDVGVAIPAAGMGRRMGGVRKALLEIAGEPVLRRTLRPFLEHPEVGWIAVALAPEEIARPPAWLPRGPTPEGPVVLHVAGGAERGDSVHAALRVIPSEAAVLLVHDAARPLVTREIIDRCIAAARRGAGVVAAVPVTDTIKTVDERRRVTGTPDRTRLWRVQTPQAFPAAVLRDAYARAAAGSLQATDDAALVEHFGGEVEVVEGSPENLKVTTPMDRVLAELILGERGG